MEAGYLPFGDGRGAIRVMEEVGQGTILGRLVGSGVATVGRVFGQTRIPAVKGQGMPAFDPRALKGMGVTFCTSPMGADHTAGSCLPGRPGFDPEYVVDTTVADGQVRISRELQIITTSIDAAGVCSFVGPNLESLEMFAELLKAKYGQSFSRENLINVGVETLLKEYLFNRKAGLNETSPLPDFIFTEALEPNQNTFDVTHQQLETVYEELLKVQKMGQ